MKKSDYVVEDLGNIFKNIPDSVLRWIIALSMAANDLVLNVKMMRHFDDLPPESHYFFRLSLSHLREIAKILSSYNKMEEIRYFLRCLDKETRKIYKKITKLLVPFEESSITKKVLVPIRSYCFHYPREKDKEYKDWPAFLKTFSKIGVRFNKNEESVMRTRYLFVDHIVSDKVNKHLSKDITDKISYVAFYVVEFVDSILAILKSKLLKECSVNLVEGKQ